MDPASQNWAVIFGWITISMMTLFGLGILFSRAENIERPALVGGLTLAGCVIVTVLLTRTVASGGPYNWWQMFGYFLITLAFYGWGRLMDYIMGPVPVDREADEATMGAHLSD